MATTQTPQETTPVDLQRPTGTTLAVAGLAMAAAGPLLIVILDPVAAPFVAPFIIVPALGAFLAWRFGTWSKVLAVVLALVIVLAMVTGPPGEGLRYFASFGDFIPSTMFLLGGIAAVVGGVTAIRARNGRTVGLEGRERGLVAGAVVLTAALGVASAIAGVATNRTVDEAAASGATEIVVSDAGYPEDAIELSSSTTTLLLRNEGRVVHTFTSDALGVDETLLPGDAVLVEIAPPPTGTLPFWCTPHSEVGDSGEREGMVGEARVG